VALQQSEKLKDFDMEEAYTDFALVYDTFMDETPYKEWAEFVTSLIKKYGISKRNTSDSDDNLEQEKNLVVELGCGTGNFTIEMYKQGFDIMGIDNSDRMLQIALEKNKELDKDILYLEQDMREIELYSTAGTFVSVCDSINYLTSIEDIVKTLEKVNNYLYPEGIFIFDFNTVHKYRDVIGDATIAEDRKDCAFIWDNFYDEDTHINEYDVTIFVKDHEDIYKRFSEMHIQKGYTLEEIKEAVDKAGMILLDAIDADTREKPNGDSERIYIIAKKNSKNNMLV